MIVATLRDTTANPAPLGLMAFGMTTVLLNLHNAGFYGMNSMILAMGIFYGGIAQVIAGIMEWKKNNTFGTTAFTSYGLFWLSFVGIFGCCPSGSDTPPSIRRNDTAMGWYLFSLGCVHRLSCSSVRCGINRALQIVFAQPDDPLHAARHPKWTGSTTLGQECAGWEGIFTGLSAMYAAIAQIWNEFYGRVVLPLGPVQEVGQTSPPWRWAPRCSRESLDDGPALEGRPIVLYGRRPAPRTFR